MKIDLLNHLSLNKEQNYLKNHNRIRRKNKQISNILRDREKFYSKSNIVIENNVNDIETVAEEIMSLVKKSKL